MKYRLDGLYGGYVVVMGGGYHVKSSWGLREGCA